MSFVTRAYNNIVATDHGTIIKSSTNPKLKDEIDFMLNLPEEMIVYFPRILDYNSDKTWVEMEHYPYDDLSYLFFSDNLNLTKGSINYFVYKVIMFLIQYLDVAKQLKYNQKNKFGLDTNVQNLLDCLSMYQIKTETEYHKLIKNFPIFAQIHDHPKIIINGTPYINFSQLWRLDKPYKEKMYEGLNTQDFNFIHGDLCFSNILMGCNNKPDKCGFKLVDPRGSFGSNKYYGDIYYDLAKLAHSVHGGYEWIINDKFILSHTGDYSEFEYELLNQQNKSYIEDLFRTKIFSGYDMRKINIIQGLIFIGMAARHFDSSRRQLAMYITGVKLLNENL